MRGCVALAMGIAMAGTTQAQWPQWRGPARDGRAPDFEVPEKWPARLQKLWEVEVGRGHSSPVVSEGRVFVHASTESGESVEARGVSDGELRWRDEYSTGYQVTPEGAWHGRGPFSTPLVAEGRVFTFGIAEVLSAYDVVTGRLLWRVDFGDQFETPHPYYGTSQSPLLSEGQLIVHAGGPDKGALVALDPSTGEERWRWDGPGPPYGSLVELELAGTRQLTGFTQNELVGVSLDGEPLWRHSFEVAWDNTVQTPVSTGELLLISAYQLPLRAFRVSRADEGALSLMTVWENHEVSHAYSTPVLQSGSLFGFSHRNSGQLYSLDPRNGKTRWLGPPRAGEQAFLVAAGKEEDATVLVLHEEGTLRVLDPLAIDYTFDRQYVVAGSQVWAHPAFWQDLMLIRDQEQLILWRFAGD